MLPDFPSRSRVSWGAALVDLSVRLSKPFLPSSLLRHWPVAKWSKELKFDWPDLNPKFKLIRLNNQFDYLIQGV
jgi:hypothetical protein